MIPWRRVGKRTRNGLWPGLLGVFFAVLVVRAMIAGAFSVVPALAVLAALVLWTAFWWRLHLTGVFVNADRVRVRSLGGAVDYPLDQVATVGSTPKRHRERRLTLHLRSGLVVETEVRGQSPQADPGDRRPGALSAEVFDRVLEDLRQRVAARRPARKPREKKRKPDRAGTGKQAAEPAEDEPGDDPPQPPPGIIEWH